jgi:glycine/D-amino acid oxidase-like deaminating enzyme
MTPEPGKSPRATSRFATDGSGPAAGTAPPAAVPEPPVDAEPDPPSRLRYAAPVSSGTLNDDFERRPFWQATLPEQPDRRGRELPDAADVVVVGGGYTGISAARELARRGAAVTVLEAESLGFGGSTRNGGIVHPGYKWGPRQLVRRYGEATGKDLFRDTLVAYALVKRLIADEAIDCDWRESGSLDLAYGPSHVDELIESGRVLADFGIETEFVPKERLREEIGSDAYYGGLVATQAGLLNPAKYFAGLAAAADRAGADLHEGVRAKDARRQADGRFVVETDRGAILAKDVVVATNGYTDGFVPALRRRMIPIGSYIIATEPLPEDLARDLSPKGRAFFDTKNFLYYWHVSTDRRMVFGGRASFMPTNVDRSARILHKGMLEVHPQLAGYRVEYAWGGNVGFTFDRMPHVGRMDGVTYAMGCCGTGVAMMTGLGTAVGGWLSGDEAPALARLRFPLVPAPYEGRPWFLPFVGEWFKLHDRIDGRKRGDAPSESASS